jgi:hypothetical protein
MIVRRIVSLCSVTITKDCRSRPDFAKEFSDNADPLRMINPISSAQASYANQVSQPAARHPQPSAQTPKSASLPQDTVTLKSTGDVDHDGDSK